MLAENRDEIMPKIYTLPKEYQIFLIPLFMALLTSAAVPVFCSVNVSRYILPLICVWFWYKFFVTAYKIKISNNNTITFHSLVRTTKIEPHEILWMKENFGFLIIKHARGRTSATILISKIREFESYLIAQNPNIDVK